MYIFFYSNVFIASSDFESLPPIEIINDGEIGIITIDDFITLEYEDRIQVTFTPSNAGLIPGLESLGEYLRETSSVDITDNDSKLLGLANIVHQPLQLCSFKNC